MKRILSNNSIVWVIILAGIIFRMRQYLYCRALWIDEAMISLNILEKDYSQLGGALEYNQAAPLGFLFIQKFLTTFFGSGELVLRLFPMVCGILALFVIWKTAKIISNTAFMIWPVLIVAFSYTLVYYSNEVKQYSTDLLLSSIVLLHFLLLAKKPSLRRFIWAGLLFGILIWLSHPIIFIIISGILFIAYDESIKKNQNVIKNITFLSIPVTISFLILYSTNVKNFSGNSYLLDYWQHAFPNIFSIEFSVWTNNILLLVDVLRHPIGLSFLVIGVFVFGLGIYACRKSSRSLPILFLLPIAGTFGAAVLHKYPFSERFLIFLTPFVVLIISYGIEYISKEKTVFRILATGILILMLFNGIKTNIYFLVHPQQKEELRDVLDELSIRSTKQQSCYVYYGAIPAFRYYQNRLEILDSSQIIPGNNYRENPEKYEVEINSLKNNDSARWYLFSHFHENEPDSILDHLKKSGSIQDSIVFTGASAFLHKAGEN